MGSNKKKAIIVGAGPAGLTAAYEFLDKTDIQPIVFEMTDEIGGISKTINYKGNRIDIGGHRFFSKSDFVMQWWQNILGLQGKPAKDDEMLNRNKKFEKEYFLKNIGSDEMSKQKTKDPAVEEDVLLLRERLSRILYLRKFFDYPISLSVKTVRNLGIINTFFIGLSYLKTKVIKVKEETLDGFFINRFGKRLYETFFKDYTEKVWGIPCEKLSATWGKQRIKGLSISKAILHGIKKLFKKTSNISQKDTETSLIEQFLYPKYGPGQMWEAVRDKVSQNGGEVKMNSKVVKVDVENGIFKSITVRNTVTGVENKFKGDYLISSMPVKELITQINDVPEDVQQVADKLLYRDFITVGVLMNKLKIKNETNIKTINSIPPDNWIYIQEPDVKVGRLQIFNNWSPYMVKDLDTVWLGMEYFCTEGDSLWEMDEEAMKKFAMNELQKIGVIDKKDILDNCVIKVKKAYPCYFGEGYDNFDKIKSYTDTLENVFLVGRNGMHRYNNQDHSMLSAKFTVENIMNNIKTKDNIWNINTEQDYHEEKK